MPRPVVEGLLVRPERARTAMREDAQYVQPTETPGAYLVKKSDDTLSAILNDSKVLGHVADHAYLEAYKHEIGQAAPQALQYTTRPMQGTCDCGDHKAHKTVCKHMFAALVSLSGTQPLTLARSITSMAKHVIDDSVLTSVANTAKGMQPPTEQQEHQILSPEDLYGVLPEPQVPVHTNQEAQPQPSPPDARHVAAKSAQTVRDELKELHSLAYLVDNAALAAEADFILEHVQTLRGKTMSLSYSGLCRVCPTSRGRH
jgi:hypothetical protein